MTREQLKQGMLVVNKGRVARVNWIGDRTGVVAYRYEQSSGVTRYGSEKARNVMTVAMDKFLAAFQPCPPPRCMHFMEKHDGQFNITRQCVKEKGHEDVHAWTREGEVSWLPDAPREVQEAFAKAVR